MSEQSRPQVRLQSPAPFLRDFGRFLHQLWLRFEEDRCPQMAAGLSYASLLALVPLLAIGLALLTAFPAFDDAQERLKTLIFEALPPEQAMDAAEQLDRLLANVAGLTGPGVLALAVTSILLLSNVNNSLNAIWRVQEPRSLALQLLVYWALLTLGPLLLGASLSISGFAFFEGLGATGVLGEGTPPFTRLLAVLLAALGGLALGVLSAADGWAGRMARLLVGLALGVPIYWTATLAVVLFAVTLGWLPSSGTGSWRQLVLPVSVLAFHTLGAIARLTQISVREVRAMLFVRTAHGKGLPAGLVLRRHVLRVALPPAVTVIALQTGFLLGGAVIIESVFVRPGIGRLLLDSTLRQDYPVVQGVVVLTATAYVALNTLADIVHRLLDPRLRA